MSRKQECCNYLTTLLTSPLTNRLQQHFVLLIHACLLPCFTPACFRGGRLHDAINVPIESQHTLHDFRHRHEPLQHLQPSPTDSSASISSQQHQSQLNCSQQHPNRIYTSAAVRIDYSRLPTIEEHVIHDFLDARRPPNVSSTPSQAAASTTSCCCLPAAFSSSASGNTTSLTFPRRHPGLSFSPSRPQRPVDARLDDEQLQLPANASANNSGTAGTRHSKFGIQVDLMLLFTLTTLRTAILDFFAHLLMQLSS